MAFTLNGSTVTHSGADTEPSLVEPISGVTTTRIGSGQGVFTIYDIGSLDLNIEGTLTIDPLSYMIVGSGNHYIKNGGVLKLGVQELLNGKTVYSNGVAWINSKNSPSCCSGGGMTVESGGTLELYGAELKVASVVTFENNAILKSRQGIVTNSHNNVARFRHNGNTTFDIDGLTLNALQFDLLSNKPAKFLNVSSNKVPIGIEVYQTSGQLVIENIPKRNGSLGDYNNYLGDSNIKLKNSQDGSNALCVPDSCNGGFGGVLYKEVNITISSSGNAIEGAKVYLIDNINGNGGNKTTRDGVVHNFTEQKVYSQITNASGATGVFEVATVMYYRNNNVGDLAEPDGNEIVNLRSNASNPVRGEDIFTFKIVGYGYKLDTLTLSLKGFDVLSADKVVIADSNISESNKSVVEAYTSLPNSSKIYDYCISKFLDNYNNETQFPINKTGDLIDLRALNIHLCTNYDNTKLYELNDIVYENSIIYKCTTAIIVAESFTIGKWTQVSTDIFELVSSDLYVYSGDTFNGSLISTGNINSYNVAVTGTVEDSQGVRVTIRYDDNRTITLYGNYCDREETPNVTVLGYQQNVSEVTFIIPRGRDVKIAIKSLDYEPLIIKYNTDNGAVILKDKMLTITDRVDTSLDVSSFTDNIAVDITGGNYNIMFSSAMTLSLPQAKAVINVIRSYQNSLVAFVSSEGAETIKILIDEIQVLRPVVFLKRDSLDSSGRVNIQAFINVTKAKEIDSSYVPNTSDSNGLFVTFIEVKPVVDYNYMAQFLKDNGIATQEKQNNIDSVIDNIKETVDTNLNAKVGDVAAGISNLNDFNPANDVVSRVTLVDTTTNNTDMRGTNSANTVAPDNESITSILEDTNELQSNQGDWSTAEIPTSDITAIKQKTDKMNFNSNDDIKATLDGEIVATDLSTLATKEKQDTIDTTLNNLTNYDDTSLKTIINSLNNITASDVWTSATRTLTSTEFSLSTQTINQIATEVESHMIDETDGKTIINAIVSAVGNTNISQIALVSAIRQDLERSNGKLDLVNEKANTLATTEDLTTVNDNVKDASLLIPANRGL